MIEYFRKNLVQSVLLFVLFAFFNLAVFVGFTVYLAWSESSETYEERLSFDTIEDSLAGTGLNANELEEELKRRGHFYLLIASDGSIISSAALPEELNTHYTLSDVASFSRWYLKGYPVNTKILGSGELLVYGFPKDKVVKYALTFPTTGFVQTLIFFPLLLVVNFLFFLFLFLRRQKNTQKEVRPVLEGIQGLGSKDFSPLDETGNFLDLKRALNKTDKILKQKEADRRDWIGGISHDVRTPLSVISASCELIKNEELSRRIRLNVLKIKNLVDSLNLQNKLNYGISPGKTETYRLSSVLRESAVGFINENDLGSCELKLIVEPELESFKTALDPYLFGRLLNNLLNNGLVHNPDGTVITVRLYNDHGPVLSVLNPIDGSSRSGTGVGLALVEKIAKYHGWESQIIRDGRFEVRIILTSP